MCEVTALLIHNLFPKTSLLIWILTNSVSVDLHRGAAGSASQKEDGWFGPLSRSEPIMINN